MTTWLYPANPKFYDVFGALKGKETYWPMNSKVAEGDILYLYLAAPHKQIAYQCEVIEVGFDIGEIYKHISSFIKGVDDGNKSAKPFMKIKKLMEFPLDNESLLHLQHLRENGLNGMLMGARKLNNNLPLLNYVEEQIDELS